ncbi:hypothetical protein HZC30_00680 [Candidatus Woesearchaeota archaeon]|nr:hypothetical protein [Candidatus Woesearchaeota archaeon]
MAINDLIGNKFFRIAGTLAALTVPYVVGCEGDTTNVYEGSGGGGSNCTEWTDTFISKCCQYPIEGSTCTDRDVMIQRCEIDLQDDGSEKLNEVYECWYAVCDQTGGTLSGSDRHSELIKCQQ